MTVGDIVEAMQRLAPEGYAYPWDRVGLRIGAPDVAVKTALVALSVTPDSVRAAIRAKAQLMVVHHPPVWEPLSVLRTDDPETRLYIEMAAAGISCYAAHTNLDVVPGGVNDILAERLGIENARPLFPLDHAGQVKLTVFVPETHLEALRGAVCRAGAGVIGAYSHCSFSAPGTGTFLPGEKAQPYSGRKFRVNEEPERRFEVLVAQARLEPVLAAMRAAHPYDEVAYDLLSLEGRDPSVGLGMKGTLPKATSLDRFAKHVKERLGLAQVRVVGAPRKRGVSCVAVLGGSGGGEIARLPKDVDAYVTGDVKYHDALSAQARGLGVIDAGHHGTEKHVVPALAAYLRAECKGLTVKTYGEPDPFRVL